MQSKNTTISNWLETVLILILVEFVLQCILGWDYNSFAKVTILILVEFVLHCIFGGDYNSFAKVTILILVEFVLQFASIAALEIIKSSQSLFYWNLSFKLLKFTYFNNFNANYHLNFNLNVQT